MIFVSFVTREVYVSHAIFTILQGMGAIVFQQNLNVLIVLSTFFINNLNCLI